MNILHLSDTTLSGSPIRIVDLLNKYTEHKARHIVWTPVVSFRRFKLDMVASEMPVDEVRKWMDWADVIHYHNRWQRQHLFKRLEMEPPKKPSLIQIHSPRQSEDFREEVESGLPIAVLAQYHVRQWPEATYIVPNVVDIEDPEYKRELPPLRDKPVVSFAPSNWNAKGWDDKGYSFITPLLKKMQGIDREIYAQIITNQPHEKAMEMKRNADIGIDEIITGSYHLSSLEYLALGIPCFANIDEQTFKVMCKITGAENIPWLLANKDDFKLKLGRILHDKNWQDLGQQSRAWMEKYWSPTALAKHYADLYADL